MIELYWNQGLSGNEIGRTYYNCCGETITAAMRRLGIPRRHASNGERGNAKYAADTHFFDVIDSESKAYVLGYFLADGHISKRNNLMFCAHEQDADIILQIKDAMKSEHPIKDKPPYKHFVITSKTIAEQLRKMGFTNHKTFDLDIHNVLQYIPHELRRHFVRGMFDGDGSIRIYHYDYFPKPSYHFGYTGLLDVVKFVQDFCSLHTKLVEEGNGIFTCISSCCADINRIGHLLYDDASIYCHRKSNTFQAIYKMN